MNLGISRIAGVALLLVAAGPWRASATAAPPPPPAFQAAPKGEDAFYGYRLVPPNPGWTVEQPLPPGTGAAPPDLALQHASGPEIAVFAFDAAGGTLQDSARAFATSQGFDPPVDEALRPTLLHDEPAVVFHGERPHPRGGWKVRCFLVHRWGVAYVIRVQEHPALRNMDQVAELVPTAFQFLRSAAVATTPRPLDHEGLGFRVRDGIAEHALAGVRASLAPGWTFGLVSGMPPAVATYAVHLACPSEGVGIVVQTFPLDGQTIEVAAASAAAARAASWVPRLKPTKVPFDLGGETVEFETQGRRGDGGPGNPPRWIALGATFVGSTRVVTVDALVPSRSGDRGMRLLREALRRVRILPPEERARLVEAMAGDPDPQFLVTPSERIRAGVYTNIADRFTWTKPTRLWHFVPHASEAGHLLVQMSSPEVGVLAQVLRFEVDVKDTAWTIHDSVLEGLASIGARSDRKRPAAATFGGRSALRSDLKYVHEGKRLRMTLITTTPIRRVTYAFAVFGFDAEEAVPHMNAALAGLKMLPQGIPAPGKTPAGWEDPAFGFRVAAPPGGVTAKEEPVRFTDTGGAVVLVTRGGERLVVAACGWPNGDPVLLAAAERRVRELVTDPPVPAGATGAGSPEPATPSTGTLAGVPATVRPAGAGALVATARRTGALFVVAAYSPEPGGAERVLEWFRFMD